MLAHLIRRLIPERFRPIGYLTHLTRMRSGRRVLKGPFAGMNYGDQSQGSAYIPKILGIYERELNGVVAKILADEPDVVIDIGAGEGYYAVGMALKLPRAKVLAFEMEETGRASISEMCALNGGVENLDVRGKCEAADLLQELKDKKNATVICDVEGYESVLLDPETVSDLKHTRILVELHDFIIPNITDTIRERFASTHDIEHIWQEDRSVEDFPWKTFITKILPRSYMEWSVSEWRPVKMAWFWMTPRN